MVDLDAQRLVDSGNSSPEWEVLHCLKGLLAGYKLDLACSQELFLLSVRA